MSAELKAPLVSIVITSYNYAKYIRDALESVAAQTYRPLECIVVDDCSTDNSAEVITRSIEELKQKAPDISFSLVSTETNSGQMAAFQLGIEKAKGVFINFLDADDFLLPDFISVHVQIHLENLVAFTFSEPVEIDSEGQVHSFHSNSGETYGKLHATRSIRPVTSFEKWRGNLRDSHSAENFITSPKYVLSKEHLKWNAWNWYPTSSALFRKNTLLYLRKADPAPWKICADCLLFCYANLMGNSCLVPFQLSAYRRHGGNGHTLDALTGKYRYLPGKIRDMISEMYDKQLPLSLLQMFSFFLDTAPELPGEFMKTVLYHTGPGFLIKNRAEVFSCFRISSFRQRVLLLFKTAIRHTQIKRRLKNVQNQRPDQ